MKQLETPLQLETAAQLETPVAMLIFNRPDQTARVFDRIARQRPRTLLLVADGPRDDRERRLTDAARQVVAGIDWPCDVGRHFSDENLGCRQRVASGIDWIFQQVREAIILEDDCLPDDSFFPFCAELLAHYRDDDRVSMISGDNFQHGQRVGNGSYYFAGITHIWGWATWRRAWANYDVTMSAWPGLRESNWLREIWPDDRLVDYYCRVLDNVYNGFTDTWDVQWQFASWLSNAVAAMPQTNLISNIGFGPGATHTHKPGIYSQMKTGQVQFPLAHPTGVTRALEADLRSVREMTALKAI